MGDGESQFCDTVSAIFGRPFVKRFALCYRSVLCLSVTFVHCGQTVGRIKMKLGMQVCLGPGHIVLGGDPAPSPLKGTGPQFSAHICCGQMATGIKICHLVWNVGLGPDDFVLDGDWGPRSDFPKRVRSPLPPIFFPAYVYAHPNFRPMFIVTKRLDG